MILQIAVVVFLVSCISCTLIICAGKWGLLTWYELRRKNWMPPSVCIFCFGFWLAYAQIFGVWCFVELDKYFFIVPFTSSSLTRVLYSMAIK